MSINLDATLEKETVAGGTNTYALFYQDQTYLTLELTDKDYDLLSKAMHSWIKRSVRLSVGTLEVRSLRSVILQKAQIEEALNDGANPAMSLEESNWANQYKQDGDM